MRMAESGVEGLDKLREEGWGEPRTEGRAGAARVKSLPRLGGELNGLEQYKALDIVK